MTRTIDSVRLMDRARQRYRVVCPCCTRDQLAHGPVVAAALVLSHRRHSAGVPELSPIQSWPLA